jgi:predicted transport protein
MPIFSNKNGKLELITETPINLEKDIQKLVEENMKTIFHLDFISSEYALNDLRVDSLGYDEESQSFVIIEYKRDKNLSVIDQGFAYLALLLNNKADFTLLYNQKTSKSLKKDDIHWDQSRIIFLSTFYTTYQRKAIELKDLPIELWEVKTYSNNTVLFNQIQHPEKGESIRTISQKSEVINKVNKEVIVSTEEMHLRNTPETVLRLYNELKENIFALGQDITLKPKRVYVAFIRKTNFADVVPRKSDIQLFLNLKEGTLNDPKKMARDISKLGHHGNGDYEVKLNNIKDIGYIMLLIRQSYDKN